MQFDPDPEIPPQPQDEFEYAVAPTFGFADRQWRFCYEIAGGSIVEGETRPLPIDPELSHEELVDLHHALRIADEDSHLYFGVQHKHLGVPVVTVVASIGLPGSGDARLEEYAGTSRFIEFAVECRKPALKVLSTVGRAMISRLAHQAMREVIAVLEARQRQEHASV